MRTRVLGSSPRSRLFAVAAAVATIALIAVILPATSASGQSVSTGDLDAGVLRLRLGAQDHFRFEPTSGPPSTQSISNSSGCRLSLGSSPQPSLVTFTTTPGGTFPGFVDNAIGVRGSGEGNGQPCGRIDAGQTLSMNLASALTGKMIDFAEIDVELKFGATLTVTGYLNGTQVGMPQTYSSTGSDSGPDSGDGDNYRIRFPKLLPECGACKTTVNGLVFGIQATGGASLEGGADGTGACDAADGCLEPSLGQTIDDNPDTLEIETTSDSLFHLIEIDGILDCPSGAGPSQASEVAPGVLESTLFRQENAIDPDTGLPQPCVPIPFNLESGEEVAPGCPDLSPQCILLQKDLLGQQTQFLWKVTWNPESTDYPETATEFDFDFDGIFQPLQPCLADSDGDGLPQLPANGDPWCITDVEVDFDPDTGQNTVTETYFGGGDPGGKR